MRLWLITGPLGAGKSRFAGFVTEAGRGPVFRADQKAKEFLQPQSPCYNALKRLFGGQCLKKDGCFDRRMLAEVVFKQAGKRQALEALIHPLVRQSFEIFAKKREKRGLKHSFCEAPPVSQDLVSLFDTRIFLACPTDIRTKRLIKKGFTKEDILLRSAVQIPKKKLQRRGDFVIDNSGTIAQLKDKARKWLSRLEPSGAFCL